MSWVQHIRLIRISKMIISYSLSFLDGPLATYETDLDVLKLILKKLSGGAKRLNKTTENKYVYQCDDYRIEIYQDHGVGHTAIGPTVMMVLAKLRCLFKIPSVKKVFFNLKRILLEMIRLSASPF